jgi:hypothetical protein
MWAAVESDQEPRDVGFGAKFQGLPGLPEIVEWVTSGVAAGLRGAKPDAVTTEFGVELAVGDKGLVAALGGLGAKTKVKVTLTWGAAPGGPAEEPPSDEPR